MDEEYDEELETFDEQTVELKPHGKQIKKKQKKKESEEESETEQPEETEEVAEAEDLFEDKENDTKE